MEPTALAGSPRVAPARMGQHRCACRPSRARPRSPCWPGSRWRPAFSRCSTSCTGTAPKQREYLVGSPNIDWSRLPGPPYCGRSFATPPATLTGLVGVRRKSATLVSKTPTWTGPWRSRPPRSSATRGQVCSPAAGSGPVGRLRPVRRKAVRACREPAPRRPEGLHDPARTPGQRGAVHPRQRLPGPGAGRRRRDPDRWPGRRWLVHPADRDERSAVHVGRVAR